MAARLDYVKVAPALVLDAGCGTGEAVGELAVRYPDARVVALDVALPMVAAARERARRGRSLLRRLVPRAFAADARAPWFVCADVNALPLPGVAFDVAWSNLALQWVNDLPRAFAEFRRVLKVGGLLTFTTFGPDTLKEIRRAFARVDGHTHTNRFVDMHDIGDMLVHAGFADPVMDMEQITLTYETPRGAAARAEAPGRDQRDARAAARAHGPRALAAHAGRARRDAARRPHSGDVRGRVRACVEGRARENRRRPSDRALRTAGPRASVTAMARGLFVAGTDTGVGKTFVAAALLRALASRRRAGRGHEARRGGHRGGQHRRRRRRHARGRGRPRRAAGRPQSLWIRRRRSRRTLPRATPGR